MTLDEAKQILENNGYNLISEIKLDKGEDIDYYQPNSQTIHDFLKHPTTQYNVKHVNDAYPLRHVDNKNNTRLRNFSVNSYHDFKKLILNGIRFKKHRSIKGDLLDLLNYTESAKWLLTNLNTLYGIDNNKFKEMAENNTEKLFNICLRLWYIYLTDIFKKCASGQLELYRGIYLSPDVDVNKFIKHNIGTSWTLNYEAAENFAECAPTDMKKYIIVAKLHNINNIDIATTLLWWYKANPFGDIYHNEDEIRIRNSKELDIVSIEEYTGY